MLDGRSAEAQTARHENGVWLPWPAAAAPAGRTRPIGLGIATPAPFAPHPVFSPRPFLAMPCLRSTLDVLIFSI